MVGAMSGTVGERRDIYSVSRLNLEVRELLEAHFPPLWIEGEISNLARPRSGHIYFSLKDEGGQVRAAMFRMHNRRLDFEPEHGMQVLNVLLMLLIPIIIFGVVSVNLSPDAGMGILIIMGIVGLIFHPFFLTFTVKRFLRRKYILGATLRQ